MIEIRQTLPFYFSSREIIYFIREILYIFYDLSRKKINKIILSNINRSIFNPIIIFDRENEEIIGTFLTLIYEENIRFEIFDKFVGSFVRKILDDTRIESNEETRRFVFGWRRISHDTIRRHVSLLLLRFYFYPKYHV